MDAARRERLLACAAKVLGAETFNRLVSSAPQTRAKGRLRFWQEELLTGLPNEGGTPLANVEEFLAVFEGAELQAITRESFLADPSRVVWRDGVQPEWILEAYRANEQFRASISYALSRSVSKGGDFSLAGGWLQILGSALAAEEVAALYVAIRDESARLEPEWRAEFAAAFPQHQTALPPINPDGAASYWCSMLYRAITRDRDLLRVRECLAELRACGADLATLPRVSPESLKLGYEVWAAEDGPSDRALTFVEVARRVGQPEIAELLAESGL